jgi:hypothetical protein
VRGGIAFEVALIRKRIEFRYSLSDVCLFRIGFNASVQPVSFNPNAELLKFPLTAPEFPDGVDVVVRGGALLPHPVAALHRFDGGVCYIRNQTPNYYIDLRSTFEEYLKGFSSKARSTLNRKVRKLSGTMEFRCFRTPEEAVTFHRLARQIAVNTYQEKLFDGAIPASDEFVQRMRRLAEQDSFRGYTLSSDGTPVSYLYLPVQDNVVTYGYLGYEPGYASVSPGTVLLFLALEQIFAESRFTYFDFTSGESQTKSLFGRGSFFRGDLYFFRSGARNALAVYGHIATDRFSGAVGQASEKLGIRHILRKLLRRV